MNGTKQTNGTRETGGTAGGSDGSNNSNGVSGANGSHPVEHKAERCVLRVVVPRDRDDNACLRVLEQLHVVVERCPGPDIIELVLFDRSGTRIELAGADISVKHSPELESQVRSLVGETNLTISR